MPSEHINSLDPETLELFALKGTQAGRGAAPVHNANALKVRRVMQLARDFSRKPIDQVKILDLACGEGVYAIEAALHGAEVRAIDARTERMNEGARAAERLGLGNVSFEQADVRNVSVGSHGRVDIIFFLGILYHLDQRDVFTVLKNIHDMCTQFVIIDTHVALRGAIDVQYEGHRYAGALAREHGAEDSQAVRNTRLLSSVDNPSSFWFTRESLFRCLRNLGFTTVCECGVPLEPFKPADRITIVAARGEPIQVSSYPWVNDKAEDEIAQLLMAGRKHTGAGRGASRQATSMVNGALRRLGFEIRRI